MIAFCGLVVIFVLLLVLRFTPPLPLTGLSPDLPGLLPDDVVPPLLTGVFTLLLLPLPPVAPIFTATAEEALLLLPLIFDAEAIAAATIASVLLSLLIPLELNNEEVVVPVPVVAVLAVIIEAVVVLIFLLLAPLTTDATD